MCYIWKSIIKINLIDQSNCRSNVWNIERDALCIHSLMRFKKKYDRIGCEDDEVKHLSNVSVSRWISHNLTI